MKLETQKAYVALRVEGYKEVYLVNVEGRDVLFRPLTFEEYSMVLDLENHLDGPFINDTIVRITIIWSEDTTEEIVNNYKAGTPDSLAQIIMDCSGFQNQKVFLELVAKKRAEASRIDSIIEMFSCAAFNISPSDFKKLTMQEQVEMFTKAEEILGQQVNVEELLGEKSPEVKAPPVPGGMESMPFMAPQSADIPDFDKILKGNEQVF